MAIRLLSNQTIDGTLDLTNRVKVSGNSTDQYFYEGERTGVGVTLRLYDNANTIYFDGYTGIVLRANQLGGSGGSIVFTGGNVGVGIVPAGSVAFDVKETDTANDLIVGLTAGTGARAQIRSVVQSANTESAISFHTTLSSSTQEKLRILATGALSVGNSGTNYGTSGQVLTSTGNAVPQWTTPTTGTITGSGTAGRVTKFTGATAVGDSGISDASNAIAITINGNEEVGIGGQPFHKLDVYGTLRVSGNSTFSNSIDLTAGQVKLRNDVALDHDGSSLYIKAPSLIYFYPGNANKGNINTSGTLTLSGGVSAASGTGHFSNVNSSSYQLNGTFVMDSSRNLVNIGNIRLDGDGKNIKFNTTSYDDWQLTVDSNGFVIYNETDARYDLKISGTGNATFAGDVAFQGTTNTYSGVVGQHPKFTQYAGLWNTKGQANNADRYMILNAAEADNYRTYITGDEVYIRPGQNSTTGQLIIRTTGATFAATVDAAGYRISGSTILSGVSHVNLGSTGSTGNITLRTTSGSILNVVADKVGIGTTLPAGLLTINGTGDAIRVESTNTGAGGAQIDLLHFTTSPADEDTHAMINMGGYYSGTTSVYGSQILSKWTDVSERHSRLEFKTLDTTLSTVLTLAHDKLATFAGNMKVAGIGAFETQSIISQSGQRTLIPKNSRKFLGNSSTGAIAITSPLASTDSMYTIKGTVFEYNHQETFEFVISGYYYQTTWYNTTAYILGHGQNATYDRNFTVRFGYDGSNKPIVYIGETNSTWSYCYVYLSEINYGWSMSQSNIDTYLDGWTITGGNTSFSNEQTSVTKSNCLITNWSRNGSDTFYSLGNVGIGTSSPTKKLDIRTDNGVLIKGATGSTNPNLTFVPASGGREYALANDSSSFFIKDISADLIRMYFHHNGNTGIGTTSPDAKLEVVNGSAGTARISSDGNGAIFSANGDVQFFTNNAVYAINWYSANKGTKIMALDNSGNLQAKADIVAYSSFSDNRLKKDIKPLANNLNKVCKLNPVEYKWKDNYRDGKTEIGLIAQEVEKIIPQVVRENKRIGDDTSYKQVDYEHLTATLIGAIKELEARLKELEKKQ